MALRLVFMGTPDFAVPTLLEIVGRGHDVGWWAGFLGALRDVDAGMAVNIEHEDQELDQLEGLRYAAETLLRAAGRGTGASPVADS